MAPFAEKWNYPRNLAGQMNGSLTNQMEGVSRLRKNPPGGLDCAESLTSPARRGMESGLSSP